MIYLPRFWAKVRIDPQNCWIWTGSANQKGYGQLYLKVNGKHRVIKAHRFAYESFFGPIPEGLELDHLCRVRQCVNPAHLDPITHVENLNRRWERERMAA